LIVVESFDDRKLMLKLRGRLGVSFYDGNIIQIHKGGEQQFQWKVFPLGVLAGPNGSEGRVNSQKVAYMA
jgi:hypothetical protein